MTVTASPASSLLPSSSPLHCSHFCFRRTRFLVAHIGRALLLAFSPTVSSCDSSEGARLFCFSQYCQRSFLNRRDRGVRQHAHNGAGFVQPQQMPTLWRPSGSVPAWSIVSERALVLEHVSLLMGRLRGPIEGGGLSACRALRLRSERSSAACCWKEWWNPILRNGTLVRICIIEVSRPAFDTHTVPSSLGDQRVYCTFVGRLFSSEGVIGSVARTRRSPSGTSGIDSHPREIIARAGSAPTFLCCILDPQKASHRSRHREEPT